MPSRALRAETGNMRFDDDWTGVFIRGDQAFYLAWVLRSIIGELDSAILPDKLEIGTLREIHKLLAASDERGYESPRAPSQLARLLSGMTGEGG